MNLSASDIERFWSKVEIRGENECWIWQATTNQSGYGRIRVNGTLFQAHRIAYVIRNGSIDDALFCCHTCDNPPCCNPSHLFLGTASDNMQDMSRKGRNISQTHPENLARGDKHGSHTHPERHWSRTHPEVAIARRGEGNPSAKLTSTQVTEIRVLRKQGFGQSQIAKMFGISRSQVARIEHGESWIGV